MTETAAEAPGSAQDAATDGSDTDGSTEVLPTDRLKQAAQMLLKAVTDKAVGSAINQVEGLTDRLGDVASNGGAGLQGVFGGGSSDDEDDDEDEGGGGGGIGGALKAGASAVKDKVTGALGIGGGDDDGDGEDADGSDGGSGGGGAGGSRGKFKFMNIFEAQDVGVPLRVAYDQWTQFGDFPSFTKKVESVEQESDEKVTWKAQVFWSHRTWETTIREQVPDSHILWVSSGAKGRADGYVSFHELAPNMTRIILVMEYYPQGFFEKTGNLWRAVGRRVRLEFKHICRHMMMDTLINREDLEGWRGEIRDSEVVKTHEEAIEEEQAAEDEYAEDELAEDELADDELEAEDEPLTEDEDADEELVAEDEPLDEDDVADEDEPLDDDVIDEDEPLDEDELVDEDEPVDEQFEEADAEPDAAADGAGSQERPRRRSRRQSVPA